MLREMKTHLSWQSWEKILGHVLHLWRDELFVAGGSGLRLLGVQDGGAVASELVVDEDSEDGLIIVGDDGSESIGLQAAEEEICSWS